MRIGYSFWGFLGAGVIDTPDGGRSHRLAWVNALRAAGHELVFLQRNRDLLEVGEDFSRLGTWDAELPAIDLLLLEWRWPIPGRNVGIPPTVPGYCGDWDRQSELVNHYVVTSRVPTIVWDKDLKLDVNSPLRDYAWVRIAEAALVPHDGARRLLFPIDDGWYRTSRARLSCEPPALAEHTLVYIGNQYERDDVFDDLFARPARSLDHAVFGKWTRTDAWPHVQFYGRIPFSRVSLIYRRSAATVLLAPRRYRAVGQFTQRIFEAQLDGCFTIAPRHMVGVEQVVPSWLIVESGVDVVSLARRLAQMREGLGYAAAMNDCLDRLEIFLASRQLRAFDEVVDELS